MKCKPERGNPFAQGQEARRRGLTKKANPYGTASKEWSRWNCGFDAPVKVHQDEARKEIASA